MKRLDLILNGKGGVGKSFFAVNFVQYLKDKGITHTAIDSDNENSTLKRFHANDADCLLTKKELAQRLKKSVRSIENWMKLRYLPYIKIGHSVLFRWGDVIKALEHFHVR